MEQWIHHCSATKEGPVPKIPNCEEPLLNACIQQLEQKTLLDTDNVEGDSTKVFLMKLKDKMSKFSPQEQLLLKQQLQRAVSREIENYFSDSK